jgi:threonine/homoserine/homoserine lactone efflux protein
VPHQLVPFLLVVAVLTVTPGPDMALVTRNGIRGGASTAWWTGFGCCTGIAVHATAAVGGLAGLLAASATAFTTLKLIGAGYLAYLGVRLLWESWRGGAAPVEVTPQPPPDRGGAYRQGLLCNLLNPKIALLFLTLLPQFVSAGEPRLTTSAVLAAIFLGIAVVWWRLFSLTVGGIGRLLATESVRRVVDRVTGGVLILLGIRVAVEGA